MKIVLSARRWIKTLTSVCILSAIWSAAELHAAESAPGIPFSTVDSSSAFRWVTHGKLYANLIEVGGIRRIYWVYDNGVSSVVLTSSISAVNELFRSEIKREAVPTFIKNEVPELLIAFLSFDRTRLLNSKYLNDYESSLEAAGFPEEIRGDKRSYDLLRDAYVAPRVLFSGATWQIECEVVCHDGALEKWKFIGEVAPFTIKSWTRELAVPPKQIRPLRES